MTRLVLWYAPAIGALATLPFVAPVLADRGLTDPQIAAVLGLQPAAVLFAAPAWSWWADRRGNARTILLITTVGSALLLSALVAPMGVLATAFVFGTYAILRAPQAPMVDAVAHATAGDRYGQVRLAGSLAFLALAGLHGWSRQWWGPAPVAVGAALLGVSALAVWGLPSVPRTETPTERPSLRPFLALGTAAVFHGIGLSFYNLFFARHVEAIGLPSTVTGISLMVAVTVEVAVMAAAPRWLGRASPQRWLLLAYAASIPRWLGTAWVAEPWALAALQGLHGLSFGVFWVAGVHAFGSLAPAGRERSAQALLPATSFGLGPLIGAGIAMMVLSSATTETLFLLGAGAAALAALTTAATGLGSPSPRDPESG